MKANSLCIPYGIQLTFNTGDVSATNNNHNQTLKWTAIHLSSTLAQYQLRLHLQ
jgi:hypothetical protein